MRKIVSTFLLLSIVLHLGAWAQNEKDWWVRVVLKNGSVIEGAALQDRFAERSVYGQMYEPLKEANYRILEGSGIRLHYVKGNTGFIFLPYVQIDSVRVVGRLLEHQKRILVETVEREALENQIRRQRELEELRAKEAAEAKAGEEQAPQAPAPPSVADIKVEKEAVMKRLMPDQRILLEKFPPGNEWNEDTQKALKQRHLAFQNSVTYRYVTFPDGSKRRVPQQKQGHGVTVTEKDFLDSFGAWQQSIAEYEKQAELLKEEILAAQEAAKAEEAPNESKTPEGKAPRTSSKSQPAPAKTSSPGSARGPQVPVEQQVSDAIRFLDDQSEKSPIEEKFKVIQALEFLHEKAEPAVAALSNVAMYDRSDVVRKAAVRALGEIRVPQKETLATLMEVLGGAADSVGLRREAIAALFKYQDASLFQEYQMELGRSAERDKDAVVRYRAVRLLEKFGSEKNLRHLQMCLTDPDLAVKVAACSALFAVLKERGSYDSDWIRTPLLEGLRHPGVQIAQISAETLVKIADPKSMPQILGIWNAKESGLPLEVRFVLQPMVDAYVSRLARASEAAQTSQSSQSQPQQGRESGEEDIWGGDEDVWDQGNIEEIFGEE